MGTHQSIGIFRFISLYYISPATGAACPPAGWRRTWCCGRVPPDTGQRLTLPGPARVTATHQSALPGGATPRPAPLQPSPAALAASAPHSRPAPRTLAPPQPSASTECKLHGATFKQSDFLQRLTLLQGRAVLERGVAGFTALQRAQHAARCRPKTSSVPSPRLCCCGARSARPQLIQHHCGGCGCLAVVFLHRSAGPTSPTYQETQSH